MQNTRRCVKKRKEYRKLVTKYSRSWQQTRGHKPMRISIGFDQIPLYQWNLVEFNRVGGIWQNLIKASEFICRVFHRDIPTVTGLVPLYSASISKFIIISSSSPNLTSRLYTLYRLATSIIFTVLSLILNYPSFKLAIAVYRGLSIGRPLPYISYKPYIPI